jgi:hypothetical protein
MSFIPWLKHKLTSIRMLEKSQIDHRHRKTFPLNRLNPFTVPIVPVLRGSVSCFGSTAYQIPLSGQRVAHLAPKPPTQDTAGYETRLAPWDVTLWRCWPTSPCRVTACHFALPSHSSSEPADISYLFKLRLLPCRHKQNYFHRNMFKRKRNSVQLITFTQSILERLS